MKSYHAMRSNRSLHSTTFYHERLQATVCVSARRDSRSLRARWKADKVMVSAPVAASMDQVIEFLESVSGRLLSRRPAAPYAIGKEITFPEGRICFRTHTGDSNIISSCVRESESGPFVITVSLPEGSDPSDSGVARIITGMILDRTRWIAHLSLIDQAKAIAEEVGRSPAGWSISSGKRVLGSCSIRGIINLSHLLVFLPLDLRRYIICHELAHLSEMNHSPQFHRIADSYCGGKEKELQTRLKAFVWPILR